MVKEITKIRSQNYSADQLIDQCKQEIQGGDYKPISWLTPSKGVKISPPAETVAVVVDFGNNRGAIRIFELEGDEYVNIVGVEEAGKQVMIPWRKNWWFRASGSLQVGYIIGREME